jgi:hypothetical protein
MNTRSPVWGQQHGSERTKVPAIVFPEVRDYQEVKQHHDSKVIRSCRYRLEVVARVRHPEPGCNPDEMVTEPIHELCMDGGIGMSMSLSEQ